MKMTKIRKSFKRDFPHIRKRSINKQRFQLPWRRTSGKTILIEPCANINLFESRCRLRKTGCTKAKISKYHVLERGNTGVDICHKMLNTEIRLNELLRDINFDEVIPRLSQIFEQFQSRHNNYNYLEKLKSIIARDSNKYTQKYKNQINQHSLKSFFNLLLHENVPVKLFGTSKNFKAIKATISRLLKTVPKRRAITTAFKRTVQKKNAIGASLDLRPLFNKFDISKMEWLHTINGTTLQWIVVLKLLHWFFAQYIIKILHKYVVLIPIRDQWIYIAKDDWCNMQEEFIKQKISMCGLVPWTPVEIDMSKFNIPIGTYKFIPGSSGVRALLIAKYGGQEFSVELVLKFLQQLYVTYINENGIPTIKSCTKAIKNFKRASTKNRYYVRCDIRDAFGSIIQKKLHDIITEYYNKLKPYSAVRTYIYDNNTLKNNKKKGTETVDFLTLNKIINKEIVITKEKPKIIKLKRLQARIKKLIFEQKVKLDRHVYLIKHGVPQGMRVSSILSEIYYQNMFKEVFSVYANNGLLCTYVDDILYITENEHYAKEFLEMIKNGIPEYNVQFNPNKIQSNVGLPYKSTKIKFLGRNITL